MKKALKIIGIALGTIVLLVAVFALYINNKPMPTYEVKAPELQIEADSILLARGEHLTHLICTQCHKGEDKRWSGKLVEDGAFGKIYAPNITQHPTKGIGAYSDGELAYLLRTGVARDGRFTLPVMSRFPHLSDEDLHSIITYLRSDAAVVQPSETVQPPSEPSLLAKMIITFFFKPLSYPEGKVESPPASDKLASGRYLVHSVAECFSCHSADFASNNLLEPEKSPGYFGGGISFGEEDGKPVFAANLTPHPEFGLGNWTEAEFGKAVRFGQGKNNDPTAHAMPRFTNFTDEEIGAMWAYLQTIPALPNDITAMAGK